MRSVNRLIGIGTLKLTHLIPTPRETGDQLDALHVSLFDRLGVLPVPQVDSGVREDGAGEPEAVADRDERDGEVGGDATGDVVKVVPDEAVHLHEEPFVVVAGCSLSSDLDNLI